MYVVYTIFYGERGDDTVKMDNNAVINGHF